MKLEDFKFRYIVPLEEKDEYDEPGFLFDGNRLDEKSDNGGLTYQDFMCGEAAALVEIAKGNADTLNDMAIDGLAFPTGTTVEEMLIAYNTVEWRRPNWNEEQMQQGIMDYFASAKIEKTEKLEKFFGYPY